MNAKFKSALILIVTLFVGMLLGGLIFNTLTQNRFRKRVHQLRTPLGFTRRLETILQPDDDQKEALREILNAHHRKMLGYQMQLHTNIDSLKAELAQVLTEEQMERLDGMFFMGKEPPFGPPFQKMPPDSLIKRFGKPWRPPPFPGD